MARGRSYEDLPDVAHPNRVPLRVGAGLVTRRKSAGQE